MKLPGFREFLSSLEVGMYSEETLYNYERDLAVFESYLSELNCDFMHVTKRVVEQYKAYLISHNRKTAGHKQSESRLSFGSMNRTLSSLRSYLKYLIDMDYQTPILPEQVKLIKTEKKVPKVADLPDLVSLIEFPSSFEKNQFVAKRNRAMLEVLFATGLRISELISLKKNQIDHTGKIYVMGKGKKERFAYLTPRALEYVQDYIRIRKDNSPCLFIPLRGSRAQKRNKSISTNYVQEKIKQYREILGINVPTSAHSLRHGFATYLAESGANPAAIQILLGHESLDTTTRYVHASDRFAEQTHKTFHPLQKS